MATYNGRQFIKEQILSILNQIGSGDELIVSDDSSMDDTVAIIKHLNDDRIKICSNPFPRSATRNFENALRQATGDIIFLADQDDVWYANKVSTLIRFLDEYDLVVSDCNFIDGQGHVIGDSFFATYKSGAGVLKNFVKNTFLGNCMAFNRSVLNRILPFPEELHWATKYMIYQDVWIGVLANHLFKVKFIPQVLSGFRRHSNNASPTELTSRSPQPLASKFQGRALLALGLLKRIAKLS